MFIEHCYGVFINLSEKSISFFKIHKSEHEP